VVGDSILGQKQRQIGVDKCSCFFRFSKHKKGIYHFYFKKK